MIIKSTIFILFSIFMLTACSFKDPIQTVQLKYKTTNNLQNTSLTQIIKENNNEEETLNEKLYSFYKEWKGVKYKFGGNSKKGIDCSALIQKVFKQKLDLNIPRTTILQSKIGSKISKSQLDIGDLVFFKTGKNSRHVGIYLENGKFFHASSKKGVTISKLDNVYFKKHYWKSRRIIY